MIRSRALSVLSSALVACASDPTEATTSAVDGGGSDAVDGAGGSPSGEGGQALGGAGGLGGSGSGGSGGRAESGPIQAPDKEWTWVPFPQAKCRDGSTTGLGVNLNPESTEVVIYLQAGGACYNANTCAGNYASFGPAAFDAWKDTNGKSGILDRAGPGNPVAEYSYFFVPYCTGDLHVGDNPNYSGGEVPGTQQFVGYRNVGHYLDRILPTVPNATKVLLIGDSAGGYGAALNYLRVQKAYEDVDVVMVDDSGPLLGPEYVNACLIDKIRTLWNADATVIAECGAACGDNPTLDDVLTASVSAHPTSRFGLISSLEDETIRLFLGLAEGNCMTNVGYPADKYTEALLALRDQTLAPYANAGTFYIPGIEHTFINQSRFYTTSVAGKSLPAWIGDLLNGTVTDIEP